MRVSTLVFLVAVALPAGSMAFPSQNATDHKDSVQADGRVWPAKNTELAERIFSSICANRIRFPDWVMKQAILETGWFRSPFLMKRNNLFGFKNRSYLRFEDIEDSIRYYKDWQDRKMPVDTEDYLTFLEKIRYGKAGYSRHLSSIQWDKTCEVDSQVNPESKA